MLFGSYAKGFASEDSDIDLAVDVDGVKGWDYFFLAECPENADCVYLNVGYNGGF
ncbi:MAG: nucleotidyltransferase domain-containing protein [Defluviitaleaceae bacterium]|nr:nucleotidyltransferase domain-containing protein [Defluviitaleaceae bacterium]